MRRAKKKTALAGALTAEERRAADDEMRRGMISTALAWYVRRAQQIGVDPMPLLLSDGGRLDAFLSSRGWTYEKATDVLRYYGLIPRRRKSGPKETYFERFSRENYLRNLKLMLSWARWIHRHVPRKLTDSDEIERATETIEKGRARGFPKLCEIVARYRTPSPSKETSLRALVAAYVFSLPPKAALRRLEALRKQAKRRTHSRRNSSES